LIAAARAVQDYVICTLAGGGLSGLAGACCFIRHRSKALTYLRTDRRGILKKGGFLTRDSRVAEAQGSTAAPRRGRSVQFVEAVKLCHVQRMLRSGKCEKGRRGVSANWNPFCFDRALQSINDRMIDPPTASHLGGSTRWRPFTAYWPMS